MLMLFHLSLALISVAGALSNPLIRQVYAFGPNTFIENIAVCSNSHILRTSESVPTLFALNPLLPSPNFSTLYPFSNATGPQV